MNEPKQIIVHHTADGSSAPQLEKVDRYHKSREFPKSSRGFYCGYHYFIEKDGSVIQTREDTDEGAHTIGQNFNSIGIGLAGNFDFQYPTPKQIAALGELTTQLCLRYQIDPNDIFPHRKFANKSCFGSLLTDNWAKDINKMYLLGAIGRLLVRFKELLSNLTRNV